jgi:branched-chain amino acid transport system substrate-binding protein
MNRAINQSHLSFCAAVLFGLSGIGSAEVGVTEKSIAIGQVAAMEGPAAGLGKGMNTGLSAYLKSINAKGGIHGRTLELTAMDDGYEPEKTGEATDKLINDNQVFCLSGFVGTPTGKAAAEIVQETKVPLVGLFTGAGAFRNPVKRYIINLRASYDDETEMLVERLTTDLGVSKIAVFYQNDAFGQAGLSGTEKALKKRNMEIAGKGTFERNTIEIKSGLAAVLDAKPGAVIMVGPYKPLAEFVKEAQSAGLKCRYATISFVGTESFIKESGKNGEGVLISQVVPSPFSTEVPIVKEYQDAMKVHAPTEPLGYVSLEGFATGKLLGLGLEKAGKDLTREKLVDTYESLGAGDLGGMALGFSATDHQGSDKVYLTEVVAGQAKPISAIVKTAAK